MGLVARLCLILLLGCLSAYFWSSRVAERIGLEVGAGTGFLVAGLRSVIAKDPPREEEPDLDPGLNDGAAPEAPGVLAGGKSSKKGARKVRPRAPAGAPEKLDATYRVPAAQVVELANSGRHPSGRPIGPSGRRPSGLLLSQLAGLGLPVQNGDVLTHVAGQHVTSVGEVVGIVLALRGRQAPRIFGIFWRAGRPFGVVVEQPYLTEPGPRVAP